MDTSTNDSNDSNFVVCRCRQCEECIEFSATDFDAKNSLITCPHCGLETRIYLPADLNHSPPDGKATFAQLDYLRSLGLNPPADLPFEVAQMMIQEAQNSAKATAKQLALIRALGVDVGADFSRAEADQITAQILNQRNAANADSAPLVRQIQILRFWDRMDLALSSKTEVAQWLNAFYDADLNRAAAWEKFQTEYADVWPEDPFGVPLAICESYLKLA